jgi:acetyltransferase-like isoleucine patch superfamily enzyme
MLDPRLLRALDRLRARVGIDRGRDPRTGRLTGALTGREAAAAGWATIGAHSYGAFTVHAGPGDRVRLRIGAYTSIAEGVEFALGGNHRADWVSSYPFRVRFGLPGAYEDGHPRPEQDIVVGSDVWLGHDALVLPGAVIGDGAVIGARAVVAKEVRPYAIVVGSPAREVRRRFDDEQVRALLRIRWWEWPENVVLDRVAQLSSGDVDGFIAAHDR